MIRSMTGFGRAEAQDGNHRTTVEVRSVNHRYKEIAVRLPRALGALEPRVLETVHKRVQRGKINVQVNLEGDLQSIVSLRVDQSMADRYLQIAQDLRRQYSLRGDLDIASFLTLPQVLVREEEDVAEEAGWQLVGPALAAALDHFDAMRSREGSTLAEDLKGRVQAIREAVGRVAERVPEIVANTKVRLKERLEEISDDVEYNRIRLEAEMTFFADRADITEECVRLRSHCEQFEHYIGDPEPAGRKLKFLLEEMHREVNTIGSKGQDTEISRDVIFMKEEVEKIREQVLNIE